MVPTDRDADILSLFRRKSMRLKERSETWGQLYLLHHACLPPLSPGIRPLAKRPVDDFDSI